MTHFDSERAEVPGFADLMREFDEAYQDRAFGRSINASAGARCLELYDRAVAGDAEASRSLGLVVSRSAALTGMPISSRGDAAVAALTRLIAQIRGRIQGWALQPAIVAGVLHA